MEKWNETNGPPRNSPPLPPEKIPRQEYYVCGPLRQAAHEPGEPESAVGNQHAAAISGLHQAQLLGALTSVEHLKFSQTLGHALIGGPGDDSGDQRAVVGRDRDAHAGAPRFGAEEALGGMPGGFVPISFFGI